jgi:hypothetical protein
MAVLDLKDGSPCKADLELERSHWGMEPMFNFHLGKPVAEFGRLWDRGSFLLWAFLAVGTFIGLAVLEVVAQTGSPPFVQAINLVSPWLLLASIIFAALAALKLYQERTIRTVNLVLNETQCYYHKAVQTDGSVNTQIVIDMQVFNISKKSIWLPDVKLLRPRSRALVLNKHVALKEQAGAYHGAYELPPRMRTDGSVNFMIEGDLTDQIARRGVKLCIEDQFGHRHILNLPNIRTDGQSHGGGA